MSWVSDHAARLEEYRNMEYSDAVQAANVVRNYDGVYVDGEYELSVSSIPEKRRDEFSAALDYRVEACLNLAGSKAWPAAWLRQAT